MAPAKKGKGKTTPKAKTEATPMDTEEAKAVEAPADENVVVELAETTAEDAKAAEGQARTQEEDAEEKDGEEDAEDEEGEDEGGEGGHDEEGGDEEVGDEGEYNEDEEEKEAEDEDADEKKSEEKTGGKPKKRFRKRGKKGQKNGSKADEPADFAGLIFMCNEQTKTDCFKYRVFGLPETKKSIVERVKKNNKLFLFDIDKRIMYGVYKASSAGGENLVSEAFASSGKKFPAQVRFRIHKECEPLDESKFRQAIKENYIGRNRFKCELSMEQVNKLIRLFRRIDAQETTPKHVKGNMQVGKFSGPRSASRFRNARSAWRPRPPDVRRGRPLYPPAYVQDAYVRDVDLRPLPLEPLEVPVRTRIVEDPYLLKRPIYQDELYAADVIYPRSAAYIDPYGASDAAWRY